jgi:eukaryotic-like serine/threonine-protein kinase
MNDAPLCPDIRDFERYRSGTLNPTEMEQLTRHLEVCPRCAETVEKLMAQDTSLGGVSTTSAEDAGRLNNAVQALIERPCLRPPWLTPKFDEVVTVNLSEASSEQAGYPSVDSLRGEIYDFLLPVLERKEPVQLGPYRVVGALGKGSAGIVLEAEDQQLGRTVALKVLKPVLAANAAASRRFLREARAAAALTHDHIVPIYHVGADRGIPYLVMPLLAGETLERRFRRQGILPLSEVLRIGREVATGLAAAHERGLVHRDIKPGNLWLEAGSGRVRILDFGLARIEEEDGQQSHSGGPVGTPAYMAPEQARGETVGPRPTSLAWAASCTG